MIYYDKEELEKVITNLASSRDIKDAPYNNLDEYDQGFKAALDKLIEEFRLDIKI